MLNAFRRRFRRARIAKPRPVIHRPRLEPLEERALPSVVFTPDSYAVPSNRADIPLGVAGFPQEPQVTMNPHDPTQLAVSSQNFIKVSTDDAA